jgi:hypothetical protein
LTSALFSCARVEASRQPVEVEMSNVDLHMSAGVYAAHPSPARQVRARGASERPLSR